MEIKQAIMTNNPCYKAGRTIQVKGLMLHSVGCPQPSAEVFYNSWNKANHTSACVHAFIDANTGVIWQTLPWNRRGWHCGGIGNNTHIGVEMCEPDSIKYTSGSGFTCSNPARAKAQAERTYQSAVKLFAYLCKEYGLDPLTSIVSHKEGHALSIATNHGDPEHLWNGLGMGYTMDGFRRDVKVTMDGATVAVLPEETAVPVNASMLTAKALIGCDNKTVVDMLGKMAQEEAKKSNILASITCAQAILESAYAHSELAVNANNIFGMKTKLSGNSWAGSTWNGTSVYSKVTSEVINGLAFDTYDDFRSYPTLLASMKDHSAYLLGAKNGSKLRYQGIVGNRDFEAVANILVAGGYATDPSYASKLAAVRDAWGLGALDGDESALAIVEEAAVQEEAVPFLVRVSIDDLRIRTGPGTQYDYTKYIPVGVYTIVETSGKWGRLKSGAGWICLDYAEKLS